MCYVFRYDMYISPPKDTWKCDYFTYFQYFYLNSDCMYIYFVRKLWFNDIFSLKPPQHPLMAHQTPMSQDLRHPEMILGIGTGIKYIFSRSRLLNIHDLSRRWKAFYKIGTEHKFWKTWLVKAKVCVEIVRSLITREG